MLSAVDSTRPRHEAQRLLSWRIGGISSNQLMSDKLHLTTLRLTFPPTCIGVPRACYVACLSVWGAAGSSLLTALGGERGKEPRPVRTSEGEGVFPYSEAERRMSGWLREGRGALRGM